MLRHTHLLSRKERGFALFEALISVLLLSIGLVVIAQVFLKSVQTTNYQEQVLYPAQNLAEEFMKELEIRSRTARLKRNLFESGSEGIYEYQLTTSDWPLTPDLLQARVTVSWDYRGKKKNVTLTTLLPRAEVTESISKRMPGRIRNKDGEFQFAWQE